MAGFLLPIAGALLGGLTGYMSAPDDNKLGGTITGGVLGGLTGGIGKLAGIGNIGKASTLSKAAGTTGRMANSSWNPVSLLKSAYTPDASGLFNLGVDALPLITDIANNDVGAKSFTGFAGTMAGTRFGGRELNKAGAAALEDSKTSYIQNYTRQQMEKDYRGSSRAWEQVKPNSKELAVFNPEFRNEQINRAVRDEISLPPLTEGLMNHTKQKELALRNDPKYSKQGYNMGVGMGADMGLYSLTSGLNKPKESPDMIRAREQQEFSDSPVAKYMQMTGML